MDESHQPNPIIEYTRKRQRTSGLAVAALFVSLAAFPVSILMPIFTRPDRLLHAPSESEMVGNYVLTFLPLLLSHILAVRSAGVVVRSRKSEYPLVGLDFSIAAIIFSTAWIAVLALGFVFR